MSAVTSVASGRWLTTALKSSEAKWAFGGWTLFIAENAIISENRKYFIEDLFNGDDQMYHLMYGTCSTIATGYIGYGYYKLYRLYHHSKPITAAISSLAPLSVGSILASWSSACIGLVMISQAAPKMQIPLEFIQKPQQQISEKPGDSVAGPPSTEKPVWKMQVRCPFDFTDRRSNDSAVTGTERITRHPGLWSIGFLGISSAFWQPTISLSVWMMGPAAVALMGGQHQDSRFRRGIGGNQDPLYASQTSNFPFVAMLSGKQGNVSNTFHTLITEEIKPLNAIVAIGCASAWIITKGRSRKIIAY